jgi:hypothetical protein
MTFLCNADSVMTITAANNLIDSGISYYTGASIAGTYLINVALMSTPIPDVGLSVTVGRLT